MDEINKVFEKYKLTIKVTHGNSYDFKSTV